MSKLFKKHEAGEIAEFSFRLLREESGGRGSVGILQFRQVGLSGPLVENSRSEAERGSGGMRSGPRAAGDETSSDPPEEDKAPKEESAAEPPSPKIDLEAVQRQAFQQGYSEGERGGWEKGMEQYQGSIAAFGRTVQELSALKNELRRQAEQELVELSLAIARRIVRRELTVDPTTIVALVHTCFEEFQRAEIHSVKVNPQDLDAVAAYFKENPGVNIEVQPDPKIERGGAVFQTAQGELDARIATQLKEIEYGLADR